ncbi:hypothetical protein KGF54_000282 [Candida jiufengensis]|uniref:uncharacterized protein n=1 Tax=Candida jiufengensis TaxID=497108 RepID=UPI002224FF80|nr:uncharacterized protein KGF54_000282 [Candida jiufengensis]KAI5957354.1 hypothetical protein KGF54_000282 [Candida jiufengensis]
MVNWNKFIPNGNQKTIDHGPSDGSNTSINSNSSTSPLNKTGDTKFHQVEIDETPEQYIDISVNLTPEELEKRNNSLSFKIKRFLWDGTGKNPIEQSYLLKLDFFLLSSSCLGYTAKYLNQSNITTSYVNGMSEYYNMNKNQYNYMVTMFTIGYIIFQIPLSILMHRVNARYYFGFTIMIVSCLTLAMIGVKKDNISSLYALRFLIGSAESNYFSGTEYILGSNYGTNELTKRSAYFSIAAGLAGIITPLLQQAIIKTFKHSSLEPFQIMFVFDFMISFVIGLYTLIVHPGIPQVNKKDTFYFTERDVLVGLERRRLLKAQLNTRQRYTLPAIKKFFNSWHLFVFPILFLCYNNSCNSSSQPTFQLFLKLYLKKPSSVYNTWPAISSAIGIGVTIIFSYLNDFLGGRKNFHFLIAGFIIFIIGCSLLAKWNVPVGFHYFLYVLIAIPPAFMQSQIFSWINRNPLLVRDDLKRNFVIVVTNTLAYVTSMVSIAVWNTKYQPEYFIGFTYTACLSALGLIVTCLVHYLTKKDEQKAKLQDASKETSSIESI